ncbi:hypothetical protein ACFFRR_011859 [Megaselia abdita]
MKCYHLILFTLTFLLSYYVAVSFAQTPRRGRIKFGRDHDDIDIQQSDRISTIENPIAEQSRTSSRFRPRTLTPSTGRTTTTTRSSVVEPESTTKKFQRSRTSKKNNEQPERKPSSRQARTFTSRSTDSASITNTPTPSKAPAATPPKFNGGRRRIEKPTTKEPTIADIEQENYPQHFKEHVKSKQPYQPKIKNRPAAYKTSTTTTTSERPQIVEVSSQSSRKSLFKPRVKVEKTKVTTSSSTTTTTSRTTRSAVRSKVFFPQRTDIEKSTADNEIFNNIPTEGEFLTTRNKFSAKFSTESPVSRKNEDALRNSKFPPVSQKFSSKYRSDSLSYSLSKTERGRQAYTPTVPPVASESKNQPVHIYPEKMMQMVYDEAAGVWNMVEIVPNGLTRSEIIVDTGDGHTQDLEDQQGSSATISIYSALADILTKNAPTTTTTTTTSTTTELPEIIKVSTTSSTADANFITTTVNTHLQYTNSNNNLGLLAGNLLQTSTSVDPYPTTTTPITTTLSELTDITTILPSNDSNRELPYIPPTNIPPPILADILTTPGSDLITQPQLISALTNYLDSNYTNFNIDSDSNITSTNKSNHNYYSVVTDEPVTISFVDLFNIKPKRVKVVADEVDVPESTTIPVNPVYNESENDFFFTTVTNELESLDEETTTFTTTTNNQHNLPPTTTQKYEHDFLHPANLPTSTYKSRFGNNRLSILPPTTTTLKTSTSTIITTSIPTTQPPRYTNRIEGILDYAVYGILPNKTVVRKKPTPKGRSLGLVVYGVLPNNTFVQKFPNGTMISVDMSSEIEVLDIDPEMLLNPNSELYRTSTSTTQFPSRIFSDNNNQIEVTISSPISDSLYSTTTATSAKFFEGYEDNLLNSSNTNSDGVLEKMDNPVLLDILKRNYIKGNGKGSKSVFSLTTAKSAIDSSTVSSNDVFDGIFGNEKSSVENTLTDSTESHETDDNFILKPINNPVLETAITYENDVIGNLRDFEKTEKPSERETSTTTTSSTTTTTTTPSTTVTSPPTTSKQTPTPNTPVPSTSSVPYYVMTVTPETVIENANSVDFERDNFVKTTSKPRERQPLPTVEKNLELLQELLALQAKIAKQNARKTTHTPATTSETTTASTTVTTSTTTTSTTPEPTTRRSTTKSATKSTFSDAEDLNFLENLKKAISQQKTTKKATTTSTSTQAPTTYMEDLYNSFQSATPSTLKKSTFSDQEDLEFLNKLRQFAKINVTTPQSPTFANRVIELAEQQRTKSTSPITTTSTTSKTTTKSNYDFRNDEAQLGQDLALLSSLLGRRISAEDIPKLNQQFQNKGRKPIPTSTKTTTTSTTEATKRPMTKDELAEVDKNLKLLSSILGRPITIEELPTIMKQYRFGRNPTVPTTTTTTTTTTSSPVINSNTPITQDEVIELLKDPEVGLGDNIDTYGKTNDAILAAVLKQKGIGPTHNNVPVDDLFLQGPTATPYATTNRPPRGRQPIIPQQQQGNPLFSGLSWLWRTWQETAPGTQPNRVPNRANRNSQFQSDRYEEGDEGGVEHPEDVPTAYPQGGGLLAAAFGVTRAVTQFLGAALQGAAKTVQNSWNTGDIDNPFATSG